MVKKTSLRQFLMKSGKFDRVEECVASIRDGVVTINGNVITNPNYFFNPEKALVKFEDEKVRKTKKLYFLLNKPAGYLSQKTENEKTIYELIDKLGIAKEHKKSLFAAGRLDKDTEGLMIITNDGDLSNMLMDPKNEITKRYQVILENPVVPENIKKLEKGVEIKINFEKYRTKPCKIRVTGEKEVFISIHEGKKRQIKEMFLSIGNKVAYLKRVSIAGIQVGKLKTGELMEISREELERLLHQ